MGQRLVITIREGDEQIAALYYHWSAYTMSALEETRKIVGCLRDHKSEDRNKLLLAIVRFAEKNGGGIRGGREDEYEYIQKLYPNEVFLREGYSRNNGLIALSDIGIQEFQNLSEGDVDIDITDESVNFSVFWSYDNVEDYCSSEDEDAECINIEEIPKFNFDLCNLSYDDVEALESELDYVQGDLFICGSEVCRFIS